MQRPAPLVDETGFPGRGQDAMAACRHRRDANGKDASPQRGREAIAGIGIIPASAYNQCTHQLCCNHLLRELAVRPRVQCRCLGERDDNAAAGNLPPDQCQ
ncbi:MAG: hypothetical protein OXC63_13760 [Aestuariivita sp.]|nr:hypothetical protein [Aestuariivita sp.]